MPYKFDTKVWNEELAFLLFSSVVKGEENGFDYNQGDKPSERGKRARGRGKGK